MPDPRRARSGEVVARLRALSATPHLSGRGIPDSRPGHRGGRQHGGLPDDSAHRTPLRRRSLCARCSSAGGAADPRQLHIHGQSHEIMTFDAYGDSSGDAVPQWLPAFAYLRARERTTAIAEQPPAPASALPPWLMTYDPDATELSAQEGCLAPELFGARFDADRARRRKDQRP